VAAQRVEGRPVWLQLVPFAGLAGIAYQHDEEVESVAGSVDHAVGSTAEEVAKSGE
jgi:hypothetical protein